MTDILTFRVDCVNKFDRNALNGYQASDLSEMDPVDLHNSLSQFHLSLFRVGRNPFHRSLLTFIGQGLARDETCGEGGNGVCTSTISFLSSFKLILLVVSGHSTRRRGSVVFLSFHTMNQCRRTRLLVVFSI